jgi:hypothetical protein
VRPPLAGQYRLLLEYIGHSFYELDKPSALDVMERVGREALVEAYQRHEITRETRSLLFCVLALLDALDLGESLKTLGLHVKMTHDDPGPRLYLVSRRIPVSSSGTHSVRSDRVLQILCVSFVDCTLQSPDVHELQVYRRYSL